MAIGGGHLLRSPVASAEGGTFSGSTAVPKALAQRLVGFSEIARQELAGAVDVRVLLPEAPAGEREQRLAHAHLGRRPGLRARDRRDTRSVAR